AMSRELMLADDANAVVDAAMRHLREFFSAENVVLLAEETGAPKPGKADGTIAGSDRERAIARWVHDHGKPAGHGTDTLPGSCSAAAPTGRLGVLATALARRPTAPTPSQRQLLEPFVAQIAQALDRVRLSEEAAGAHLTAETERTRSTLLSAVSHDLRTPLT